MTPSATVPVCVGRELLTLAIVVVTVAVACRQSVASRTIRDEARDATASAELPGTYDVAVCRGRPCVRGDTATAYVLATVVLFDSSGAVRADLPPPHYEHGQRATGCFWIRHRRSIGDSYAGITSRAYFTWREAGGPDGIVRLPLYRSPDAGYIVDLFRNSSGLTGGGRGTSYGVGAAEIHAPSDTVLATRVGPADRLRCHTTG